jgi:hypothetical protein
MTQAAEWREYDLLYACSKAGVVINRKTGKPRPVEDSPLPADKYVRLVLKRAPNRIGGNNQKRMALRNVVAHCWLPDFELGPDGEEPTGCERVYQLNRDPKDCRAANLVVLTEQWARQRGLVLTSRCNRGQGQPRQQAATAGAGRPRMPCDNHRQATPDTPLQEQIHLLVAQQGQLHLCEPQHGLP